jgi:hypothetical protein
VLCEDLDGGGDGLRLDDCGHMANGSMVAGSSILIVQKMTACTDLYVEGLC